MQALSPASSLLQPPVSLLEKTPAILETLLRDVPAEILDWKPAPDRWSITEVLAHLLMIEQLYGDRAKRIVVDNNPTLEKYFEPDAANLRKKTSNQYLKEFVALRQANYFFLARHPFFRRLAHRRSRGDGNHHPFAIAERTC